MQSLVSRLETVTSRLERLAAQGGARGGGAAEGKYISNLVQSNYHSNSETGYLIHYVS